MRLSGTVLFICFAVARTAFAAMTNDAKPPYGHRDFYPSSERTVGLRGDGSGAWPGATPVREWNAKTGKNLAWKTPMPGPSFSQPIIVGDKVFTLADPNWLICLSAHDGKILWQRAVDHTLAMPPEKAAQARERIAFWEREFRNYAIWLDLKRGYKPKLPQEEIDRALKAADEHGYSVNGPGQANFSLMRSGDPLWQRLWKDQSDFSLYYFGHWEGILTQTLPTPVSDGEHVFVNMSNDQMASYDLEGNCQWLIWDRPAKASPARSEHVRYALSPRLVGDRLIVTACGEMRAYDKHTGKKLWGVFRKKDFGDYWVKISTPVPMRLNCDGQTLDVLLSPGSGVYRVRDGQNIGTLPELKGYEGALALTDGETYVHKDAPDSGNSIRVAGKFKVTSADQVEFVESWRTSGRTKSGNVSDVLFNGWIYSPHNAQRVEMATGRIEEFSSTPAQYPNPSLGGKLLITLHGGTYERFGRREKNPGVMSATVVSLDEPMKAAQFDQAFSDDRYEVDEAFRLRWRWRGNADAMSNSSPMFQGNRMFFRTAGYLWCVGDRNEPWQSPTNAAAAARVTMNPQ